MSSVYTDLTYQHIEDLWAHPNSLTGLEYELVKFALDNALSADEEYDYVELKREHELAVGNIRELEVVIQHNDATIDRLDLLVAELQRTIDDLTSQLQEGTK